MHTGDPIAALPLEVRERARKRPQPSWFPPMLTTLAAEPVSGPEWIFEPKLDGERCLTFRKSKAVRLFSRNKIVLNDTYPELVEPLGAQQPESYIADGEIVAFRGDVSSFAQLQRRMQVRDPEEARRRGIEVFYYLFDLLYLNGYDLSEVPLICRKHLLKRTFAFRSALRFTGHRRGDGEAYFRLACRKGLEGMIAKRAHSVYVPRRSRDWLKVKCWSQQEFVIGGYTDPKGGRAGFGALLLGYYEGNRLIYAGKVGTGFNTETLVRLHKELSSLKVSHPPFAGEVPNSKGVHWVKPKLVAEVSFTGWTEDGKLRHPRFLGLRRDKDPCQVVREEPA